MISVNRLGPTHLPSTKVNFQYISWSTHLPHNIIKGAVSPIVPSESRSFSRHSIFYQKCVSFEWYFQSMFHPRHRLFSWLRNHSTMRLTIPLGDWVFFSVYEHFLTGCKQNKGVAETAPVMPSMVQVLVRRLQKHEAALVHRYVIRGELIMFWFCLTLTLIYAN